MPAFDCPIELDLSDHLLRQKPALEDHSEAPLVEPVGQPGNHYTWLERHWDQKVRPVVSDRAVGLAKKKTMKRTKSSRMSTKKRNRCFILFFILGSAKFVELVDLERSRNEPSHGTSLSDRVAESVTSVLVNRHITKRPAYYLIVHFLIRSRACHA